MSEIKTPQKYFLQREVEPFDWWSRTVLSRVLPSGAENDKPLTGTELDSLAGTLARHSAGDIYNLRLEWDYQTGKTFVECNTRGQNQTEAAQNTIRPLFWGLTESVPEHGRFRLDNMQLAAVLELELIQTDNCDPEGPAAIGSPEFEVTETARQSLRECNDLREVLMLCRPRPGE